MTIPLIGLGILLSSYAYIPVLRAILGIDEFAALAGLITWYRTIAIKPINANKDSNQFLRKPHLLGLSFLLPIPFLSCLILGWFWQKDRPFSIQLDETYREVSNFHLSLHLYLLVSFFLMPIFIGFLMFALLIITYLLATIYHVIRKPKYGAPRKYPINIQIAIPAHTASIEQNKTTS